MANRQRSRDRQHDRHGNIHDLRFHSTRYRFALDYAGPLGRGRARRARWRLAYGELGSAMPEAGGEYVFLREAYGPVVAYLSGWTSFFAGFSGAIAAALLAFAGYACTLLPALGNIDA